MAGGRGHTLLISSKIHPPHTVHPIFLFRYVLISWISAYCVEYIYMLYTISFQSLTYSCLFHIHSTSYTECIYYVLRTCSGEQNRHSLVGKSVKEEIISHFKKSFMLRVYRKVGLEFEGRWDRSGSKQAF